MKRLLPVLVLALLSPFIAEVLLGATPLSRADSLLPLTLLYGGGAVAIRELARRRGSGWSTVLWLGAAYGLVEEGLVMQTLFSPDLFDAAATGGRALGVNWVWAQVVVGYHVVWSIAIPIALTEILFRKRGAEPWLGRTELSIALACYAVGALAIGFTFRTIVTPNFRASAMLLATAAVAATLCVAWALREAGGRTQIQRTAESASQVSPLRLGLASLLMAAVWLEQWMLPAPLRAGWMAPLTMVAAAALALAFAAFVRQLALRGPWTDLHRLALASGALVASMAYGVRAIAVGTVLDRVAHAVCCAATALFLAVWAWRLRRCEAVPPTLNQATQKR
ncbi:MAG: hypothetical protein WCE75_02525 [Terracidiphilus sp.]